MRERSYPLHRASSSSSQTPQDTADRSQHYHLLLHTAHLVSVSHLSHPGLPLSLFSVRSALFSSAPGASSSPASPMRPNSSVSARAAPPSSSSRSSLLHAETSATLFEQQNNALADALHSKVSALKSLSIAIGEETKAQNRMLDDMDGDFDAAGGGLKGVVGRLGGMLQQGGSQHMCWLVAFICFIFLIVYLMKR